ncbi:hypothetical protein CONLIGDRAFT_720072 [Coniochaeta ligniaria NRRL 30616]|uniref:Uncharacterized protein n=1 Tax=Coniochaeta ligniaria NRRL 30616 TaxID=1408157 RepID=A0A1J7I428_9PEZI|nr:hypothetical protein CONLIGDRAFT_720072 [Coniochaeta ligniaria NRRL 30616]
MSTSSSIVENPSPLPNLPSSSPNPPPLPAIRHPSSNPFGDDEEDDDPVARQLMDESAAAEEEQLPRRGLGPRPPHTSDAVEDEDDAPPMRTARGIITTMPERDAEVQAEFRQLSAEVNNHSPAIKARWEKVVALYWRKAKAIRAAQGGVDADANARDVRDFVAVAERQIDLFDLDATLAVVFADMPAAITKWKTLPAALDRVRTAINNSINSRPGATTRDSDISKWRIYLWFGREICTTVRQVNNISALLQATTKTEKIEFADLTNRLWKKVFAELGEEDEFPWPRNHHLIAVQRECEEEKRVADEAAKQAKREREARRQAIAEERAAARQRGQIRRGKRPRPAEAEDEDGDESEDMPRGPKRRRTSARLSGGFAAVADDGDEEVVYQDSPLAMDEPEVEIPRRRDSSHIVMDDDELLEANSGETAAEIGKWLAQKGRILRLLQGPADPDGVLPDDVKQHLASLRMGVESVASRLEGIQAYLDFNGPEGSG